ncbi:energy transducer TonB [Pedobacter jejuensis]|uniref:Energy transducer TonB n=1 Tax=Pedobacter jejuensis TaxID=1268550 RepID=A0A3N0BSV3_9SPHI|nr:energy transducer TonB [Pedobacter jejuensis]RNL51705.1 energy transducer TonB [Pedobacter jejuensis]
MKKIIIIVISIVNALNIYGQNQAQQVVAIDTINVRGKIISLDGSKISNVLIKSKTPNQQYYNSYNVGTITDSVGNFILDGIKPTDTLSFRALGAEHTFVNYGSRQILIRINPKINEINNQEIAAIYAKRVKKKKLTKFTLIKDDVDCYYPAPTQSATFPGGITKFTKFINGNLDYPLAAVKNNIEGMVSVEFDIERDGSISNPRIINTIGYGCSEAAVKVISKSPRWIPEIANGKPIKSIYKVDIAFKLQD